MIVTPSGEQIEKAIQDRFKALNNKAEYKAVIYALKATKVLGAKHIRLLTDSKLLASQFKGLYEARYERMVSYLDVL